MKLSKNLLQAMAVGLAIGAAVSTSSCSLLTEESEIEPHMENPKKADKCETEPTADYNCPACGLG